MRDYELTLVVDPELTSVKQKAFLTKIKKLIADAKGKLAKTDEWGKKELVYPIKKKKLAYFFLLTVSLPENQIADFEKKLKMEENLWRYLFVLKN